MEKKNTYLIGFGIGIIILIIGFIFVAIHTEFGWYGLLLSVWAGIFIFCGICSIIFSLNRYSYYSKDFKQTIPSYNQPKYCPICGTAIKSDSNYCTNCGNKIQ